MTKKLNHPFKVLQGGLLNPREPLYQFVSAFVTNTRLMGVEVLYIHWEEESGYEDDFHQFFYFDGEEYGLENYVSYIGNDQIELDSIEGLLSGGLGGEKSDLTEVEARFLVQDYLRGSKRLGVSLPLGHEEFAFLLDPPVTMSSKERRALQEKECAPLETKYQPIHYFLMRVFARDFEYADYLSNGGLKETDLYPELAPCTLVKNTIEDIQGDYLCESLLDCDGQYYIAVSEIALKSMEITGFKRHKLFHITPYEAGLLVNRIEYITCYDYFDDSEELEIKMPDFDAHPFMSSYEKGQLFMLYNSHNDHVRNPVFKIHEDVYGSYFVSNFGQVLVSSFVLANLAEMEMVIALSHDGPQLIPQGRFEFKEPVLYEFIQDDIDDFLDFIDFYKE